MKLPTREACSSTSLTEHILATVHEKTSREGAIKVFLSDPQRIYCTRKISRIKSVVVHKKVISFNLRIVICHNESCGSEKLKNTKCIMPEDDFAKEKRKQHS